ncbi:Chitin-binding protein [Globisporangium polare]
MNGMVYELGNPVTELTAGVEFPIKWFIQAPHPGYGEFSIVKPTTKDASGKIMCEKVVTLKRLEPFGTDGGNFDTTAMTPASVTGCEKAGDCALQMYWHSDIANQTYPTCADITIKGATVGGSSGSSANANRSEVDADSETETPAAVAPTAPDDDGNDEYETPAPAATKNPAAPKSPKPTAATTTTPAKTPAPATATPVTLEPTATKKKSKCKAKTRGLRQ